MFCKFSSLWLLLKFIMTPFLTIFIKLLPIKSCKVCGDLFMLNSFNVLFPSVTTRWRHIDRKEAKLLQMICC